MAAELKTYDNTLDLIEACQTEKRRLHALVERFASNPGPMQQHEIEAICNQAASALHAGGQLATEEDANPDTVADAKRYWRGAAPADFGEHLAAIRAAFAPFWGALMAAAPDGRSVVYNWGAQDTAGGQSPMPQRVVNTEIPAATIDPVRSSPETQAVLDVLVT